jgi:uncharacterized protein (UPF0248 family)
MKPIQDLLHRIRWDPEYGRAEFVIGYWDRIAKNVVRVPFRRVSFARDEHFSFDVVADDGTVHSVPLHRVREVWRDGELVWRRAVPESAH